MVRWERIEGRNEDDRGIKRDFYIFNLNIRLYGSIVYWDSVLWDSGRMKGSEGGNDEF